MPDYETVNLKLAEIEAEMKRIGMWQQQPLTPDQMQFTRAFGGDKMAFEQWLQFVFIARVKEIIASRGIFPSQSQVSDQTFREWKMWGDRENVDDLLALMKQFDALFS